jgi:hypothetical protein
MQCRDHPDQRARLGAAPGAGGSAGFGRGGRHDGGAVSADRADSAGSVPSLGRREEPFVEDTRPHTRVMAPVPQAAGPGE